MAADFCSYCQRPKEPTEALAVLYRLLGRTEDADVCDHHASVGLVWACRSCGTYSTETTPSAPPR